MLAHLKRSFFLVALGKQLVHGALLCFPLFNWSMLMKDKYRQFNFFGNNIKGDSTYCPPCSVPKWKKANEPTRGSFGWKISWKSNSVSPCVFINYPRSLKLLPSWAKCYKLGGAKHCLHSTVFFPLTFFLQMSSFLFAKRIQSFLSRL